MAPTGRAVAAAGAGALLAQVLPFAGPTVRAAWCWDFGLPVCKPPIVLDGTCEECAGSPDDCTIGSGTVCTPTCANGKVPKGACEVHCPWSGPTGDGSGGLPGCYEDLNGESALSPWWTWCDFGDFCQQGPYQLGDAMWGTFECVDPAEAVPCEQVSLPTVPEPTCWSNWDCPTGYVVGWYAVACVIGAFIGRLSVTRARVFFQDVVVGPQMWSLANVAGVLLVVLAPILYVSVLAQDATSTLMPFLSGLAAGLVVPLPLAFALFKYGAQDIVNMSTERSWRIHAFFGFAALMFSTAHGVITFLEVTDALAKIWWIFGLFGLVLMWCGVLATPLYELFPCVLAYDRWKLLHWASLGGFIFSLLHMVDHATALGTARSWLVTIVNLAVLAAYALQKVVVYWTSRNQAVLAAEVLGASGGTRYISIRMKAPKFAQAFKPGQWGHLTLNGVTKHPFTCMVPQEPGEVTIVAKVSGAWTAKLAAACANSTPRLRLEGPYGVPCLPDPQFDAAVFVLGGVGVTPALSLAPLAVRSGLKQVHLYWSLREEHLLLHCAPYLAGLDPEHTCVRVTRLKSTPPSAQEDPDDELPLAATTAFDELPLAAQYGRADLRTWLQAASKSLSDVGAKKTLVFICGPPQLGAAARAATAALHEVPLTWYIHQEEFTFLPTLVAAKKEPRKDVEPSKIGNDCDPSALPPP